MHRAVRVYQASNNSNVVQNLLNFMSIGPIACHYSSVISGNTFYILPVLWLSPNFFP